MPRLFVFNVPAQGHVNATFPVVAELVRRGVEVDYFLTPAYQRSIEAMGAVFRPYDTISDDYFEVHELDGSNPPRTSLTLATSTLEMLPRLVKIIEAEKPDAILYDSMCPWGWLVAKATNTPALTSMSLLVLTPKMILGSLPPLIGVLLRNLGVIPRINRIGGKIARAYGVKSPNFMDFINHVGNPTISYTARMIQPDGDRMPAHIHFVGPSIENRLDSSGFPFEQLNRKPLIYISLGTVINQNLDFYRQCFAAFQQMEVQVVMSVGKKTDLKTLGEIPQNFIVRNFVPQLEILQRAALFITHAGMNSVHEGLYYNVPLLLVPQQDEQRLVARRIERLGAGVVLDTKSPTAQQLCQSAEKMMGDINYKIQAEKVGESLRQAGGHQRAADIILARIG